MLLETMIGYQFKDVSLLENALRHSSYANEHRDKGFSSNERLEFLGDSILGMITAEYLYKLFPREPEGVLTRTRAALVCEDSLAKTAAALELGGWIKVSRGELHNSGTVRKSIQADAVEAIIAAIYLDGGRAPAEQFIHRFILDRHSIKNHDYKTRFQELVQRTPGHTICYEAVSATGPAHDRTFVSRVLYDGTEVGRGSGKSKKEAEQSAACQALQKLSPAEL